MPPNLDAGGDLLGAMKLINWLVMKATFETAQIIRYEKVEWKSGEGKYLMKTRTKIKDKKILKMMGVDEKEFEFLMIHKVRKKLEGRKAIANNSWKSIEEIYMKKVRLKIKENAVGFCLMILENNVLKILKLKVKGNETLLMILFDFKMRKETHVAALFGFKRKKEVQVEILYDFEREKMVQDANLSDFVRKEKVQITILSSFEEKEKLQIIIDLVKIDLMKMKTEIEN